MKRYVEVSLLIFLIIPLLPVFKSVRADGTSTTIAVNPPESYVTVGKSFSVDINVTNVANLTSWQFTVYFLNNVLNCTNVVEGPFLKTGGGTYFGKTITNAYNSTHGSVLAYDTLLGDTTVNGSGVLATITFNALSVGDTTLHVSDTKLGDENLPPHPIDHTIIHGTVHVQSFTLTVSTVGSGYVNLNNTGPYYHYGEVVTLAAVPAVGWSFQGWSGNLTGSTNPAFLVITGNMSVTATFTQDQYTLVVTVVGGGSVTKNPSQATYVWGTNVTLTANASVGWTFAGWSGDASGSVNPIYVNMTSNKSVTATFTQITYTLTVNVVGQGSVTLNNTGPYHFGDTVLLTATAAVGWSFDHWSGHLSGSTNPGTLTIIGNMSVTAQFTDTYTLTVRVGGSGSVNTNSTGPYHYGDVVRLTAVSGVGWFFDHWTGDLSGYANPADLTITGNMSVTAWFDKIVYTLKVSCVGDGNVIVNQTEQYYYGDVVQFVASASEGWTFFYWTGDLSGSDNPAVLAMTWPYPRPYYVTAHFVLKPVLQINPVNKICRAHGESFTLTLTVSGAVNFDDFEFEIRYNTTLLDYLNVAWNAWGSGTINVDDTNGIITGTTSGSPLNGTQDIVTIGFQATCYHVWKATPSWTNDLTDTIFLQRANLSYLGGSSLRYERGGALNQINVGPDFIYTFSPIQGDVNNDGFVDIFDLRPVGAYYNVQQGDPNWTAASTYDLNGDGIIDITDLRLVAVNFGYVYIP